MRERWLSYYWAVSGDRQDCAYTSWSHLTPSNPDQERLIGVSCARLATWRMARAMRGWQRDVFDGLPCTSITRSLPFRGRSFLAVLGGGDDAGGPGSNLVE